MVKWGIASIEMNDGGVLIERNVGEGHDQDVRLYKKRQEVNRIGKNTRGIIWRRH